MKWIKKIKTIINSRFKTTKEQPTWLKKRRETCLGCKHNSLNISCKTFTQTFLATLSYFFSWITGKAKDDNLGNCLACNACSIYFKTNELEEICPKDKWDIPQKGNN